jgi:hypothetical protein
MRAARHRSQILQVLQASTNTSLPSNSSTTTIPTTSAAACDNKGVNSSEGGAVSTSCGAGADSAGAGITGNSKKSRLASSSGRSSAGDGGGGGGGSNGNACAQVPSVAGVQDQKDSVAGSLTTPAPVAASWAFNSSMEGAVHGAASQQLLADASRMSDEEVLAHSRQLTSRVMQEVSPSVQKFRRIHFQEVSAAVHKQPVCAAQQRVWTVKVVQGLGQPMVAVIKSHMLQHLLHATTCYACHLQLLYT